MKLDSQLPGYYATTTQSGYNKKRLGSIAESSDESVQLVQVSGLMSRLITLFGHLTLSVSMEISPSYWVRFLFAAGVFKEIDSCDDASHGVVRYGDEIRSWPIMIQRSDGRQFIDYQYIRYVFHEGSESFKRTAPIDFVREPALYSSQVFLNRDKYGSTPFSVHISSSPTSAVLSILKDQVLLSPLIYFEGFCVLIWTFTKYTTYTILILSLVIVERFAAMRQSFQNWSHLLCISSSADNQEVTVIRLDDAGTEVSQPIRAKELVPGDHIVIVPNMHIPCDCVLIKGEVILDVSFVTGESRAVRCVAAPPGKTPKSITSSLLLCGSKALRTRAPGGIAKCRAIVVANGFQTLQGNFLLSVLFRDPSPAEERLQFGLARSVAVLVALAAICMTYTFIVSHSLALDPTEITVRVFDILTDALPPALPLALSIATLAASFRLPLYVSSARSGRATHLLAGLVNTVVLDKTNTITTSEMAVTGVLEAGSQSISQCPGRGSNLELAIAACNYLAVLDSGEIVGDPLEVALIQSIGWEIDRDDDSFVKRATVGNSPPTSRPLSRAGLLSPVLEHTNADALNYILQSERTAYATNSSMQILASFPFNPVSMRMSVVARLTESDKLCAFSKGAYEQIISNCDPDSVPFTLPDVHERLSSFGYRILAYSYKPFPKGSAEPELVSREEAESNMTLCGIVLLSNQLHPESKVAIQQLRASNINVILCTGDSSGTAAAVARQCGITGNVEESQERTEFLYRRSNPLRDPLLPAATVYSRMTPDDKALLVESLAKKARFGAVLMCGDGPNDANALCAADVGLVVNATPNPLLESAAGCLVCLDPTVGLSAVVEVVTLGRSAVSLVLCIAKIIIAYAVIEGTCVTLCYSVGDNLTDFQYALVDMGIVLPTVLLLAVSVAPSRELRETQTVPPLKVSSIGLAFHCAVSLIWQVVALLALKDQDWYVPFQPSPRMLAGPLPWAHVTTDLTGLENTVLFIMCCFQCILVIVLFTSSTLKKWCRPLHESILLAIWIRALVFFVALLAAAVTVLQDTSLGVWVMNRFDLVPLQGMFIFQLVILVLTQSLISFVWELRVLPRIEREVVREYIK